MNVVHPAHLFGLRLDVGQIEIDDHWLLAAAHDHARQRQVVARIDLLMWNAPVLALGSITTVPAQSFSAPARAWLIAAARSMPGVCGVFGSSSFARATRTPSRRHLDLLAFCIPLSEQNAGIVSRVLITK